MTIDLNLTSEQVQIIDAAKDLLSDRFPVARLRAENGHEADIAAFGAIVELGGLGLGSPEHLGGAGFGILEEMLLFVEFGRHLVTPQALAGVIGARVAEASGKADLARDIIAGQTRLCVANPLTEWRVDNVDGVAAFLIDSAEASLALLWNKTGCVLLDLSALSGIREDSADASVTLHRCVLKDQAVVARIADPRAPLLRKAYLLMAAQCLGVSEATRDMSVAYAGIRRQFGQPIGAFQAVKHKCADMAIRTAVLKGQLNFAAIAERDGWSDVAFQIKACRLLAARTALENARANIQVHGAIGFSAECDAHLYLLRAHLYETLGGREVDFQNGFLEERLRWYGHEDR